VIFITVVSILCLFSTPVLSVENAVSSSKSKTIFTKSIFYFKQNQFSKAIESLNEAIALDRTNYIFYYNLGTIYLRLKKYDESINNLLISLKYNPEHQESYYNLGLCHLYKNEYLKSADYFKRAIELNQYDIEAHNNLGLAYKNLKQYESAIMEYQKALQIDHDNIPSLINLAIIYKLQGDIDKSSDLFNKVISVDPGNSEALYNLTIIGNIKEKQKSIMPDTLMIKYKSSVTGKEVTLPLTIEIPVQDTDDTKALPVITRSDTQFKSNDTQAVRIDNETVKFKTVLADLQADISGNTYIQASINTESKEIKNEKSLDRELVSELKNLISEFKIYNQNNIKIMDKLTKMEKDISEVKTQQAATPSYQITSNNMSNLLDNILFENSNTQSLLNSFDFDIENNLKSSNSIDFTDFSGIDINDASINSIEFSNNNDVLSSIGDFNFQTSGSDETLELLDVNSFNFDQEPEISSSLFNFEKSGRIIDTNNDYPELFNINQDFKDLNL